MLHDQNGGPIGKVHFDQALSFFLYFFLINVFYFFLFFFCIFHLFIFTVFYVDFLSYRNQEHHNWGNGSAVVNVRRPLTRLNSSQTPNPTVHKVYFK